MYGSRRHKNTIWWVLGIAALILVLFWNQIVNWYQSMTGTGPGSSSGGTSNGGGSNGSAGNSASSAVSDAISDLT